MFLVANFVEAMAYVLRYVLEFYWWALILRAFISWVNPDPFNPIVQFLHRVTDPVLVPIQRRVPPYWMGIDISPLVALLLIHFLRVFLVQSLSDWAYQLRL